VIRSADETGVGEMLSLPRAILTSALIIVNTPNHYVQACQKYQAGQASWYGPFHHGRKTASGTPFNMNARTAAHRTIALGTRVRVYNPTNNRSIEVLINDRGPYVKGRIIDLSRKAATDLGLIPAGHAPVIVYNPSCG
jgi:rare lipoprotein A